jgi:superfamily II DNA or RNA helicase
MDDIEICPFNSDTSNQICHRSCTYKHKCYSLIKGTYYGISDDERMTAITRNYSYEDIRKIVIDDDIKQNLLEYQHIHVRSLVYALQHNKTAFDLSDTGTGKTYTTIAISRILGLKLFVVCPKSIITCWDRIATMFGSTEHIIVNYETFKLGKYYKVDQDNTLTESLIEGKRIKCPYIKRFTSPDKKDISFEWNLPSDYLIVFDEAHSCKNKKSQNGALIKGLKHIPNERLLLSATIVDKPDEFKTFADISDIKFPDNPKLESNQIFQAVFPNFGSRMKIKELDGVFPDNQISADSYYMGRDTTTEINKLYQHLEKIIDDYHKKAISSSCYLVELLRFRQKLETLKIPTLVRLINSYLRNGKSIVVFVNFKETLHQLATEFSTKSVVHGGQTIEDRELIIRDFQNDNTNLIICNIQAGGQSISLHDTLGNHQRVSIICPTWSAIKLIQALGRIHRAGSKSPALQRIIYCSNTIEEQLCRTIKTKLDDISQINDGDLEAFDIKGLPTDEVKDSKT